MAASWAPIYPTVSPSAREAPNGMCLDRARNIVVLFGERNVAWNGSAFVTAPLNDTWEWDGVNWSQVVTAHHPSNLSSPTTGVNDHWFAVAFDPVNSKVICIVSNTATATTQTWSYDGTDWTQLTPVHEPVLIINFDMATDVANNQIMLVSRQHLTGSPDVNATWTWDGTDWTNTASPVGLAADPAFSLAYDEIRGVTVLFDGIDTWEWDGISWTHIIPTTSPSLQGTLAWSKSCEKVVLATFSSVFQTWLYDGTTWTSVSPAGPPEPRVSEGFCQNVADGGVLLFGGVQTVPAPSDRVDLPDMWTFQCSLSLPRGVYLSPAFEPFGNDRSQPTG